MKYVTPKEASQLLGVSISSLRRWESDGKIKSIRTPGGQRRYCLEDYEPESKSIICYARVSTHGQKDDLERQAEFLRSKYPRAEIITEIGSGLNFKRKRFLSILERIHQRNVALLLVYCRHQWFACFPTLKPVQVTEEKRVIALDRDPSCYLNCEIGRAHV